ncbi:ImmA/IrrE family metallo-endopeptidase [Microcoleus sp. FACHB-831]|uniref:ImmA/IrrE family metallo-endopeptidase n=1 Tax=Microcoleus sp. FACHB-831 TaxID=2692827 RepID=UPI001685C7D2|nr:ImmA/IrrE family metallo-endopeptidase [Microcoleus sp. FACHB-831]MBD1923896.1 ImmA/IrrE family metallo-endopeptidase [Microcoleus sp. FACHB-831]
MSVIKPHRFYSKEEIENRANDLLMRMQETPNFPPKWPLDASRVADFLDLAIVWDIIPTDEEAPIAARIFPLEHLIEINEDILKLSEGYAASTIAHEIGHWVLHINQDEADSFVEQMALGLVRGTEATVQPFLCRSASDRIYKSNANNQIDWREWQAQYFASCLLMPRYILENKRKGRDLTNWRHLYAMAEDLGVTISNLKNRLQDLGWIHIPKDSRQIYLGSAAPSRNK